MSTEDHIDGMRDGIHRATIALTLAFYEIDRVNEPAIRARLDDAEKAIRETRSHVDGTFIYPTEQPATHNDESL